MGDVLWAQSMWRYPTFSASSTAALTSPLSERHVPRPSTAERRVGCREKVENIEACGLLCRLPGMGLLGRVEEKDRAPQLPDGCMALPKRERSRKSADDEPSTRRLVYLYHV